MQVETNAEPAELCASRKVLDRIGDTWSLLIVGTLADGSLRYTELAKRVTGVSPKMLTQTLRGLERDGLVGRTVHAVVPPRVDYELTKLGRSLLEPVSGIGLWARQNREHIEEARRRFGTTAGAGKS